MRFQIGINAIRYGLIASGIDEVMGFDYLVNQLSKRFDVFSSTKSHLY